MSQAHSNLGNGRVEALEQRVHRLEDAVAAFQDTRQLEERLVERVSDRVRRALPSPGDRPATLTVDVRRPMLPAARPVAESSSQSWLLLDVYRDVRAIFRMFFDYRYRTSRWVGFITVGLCVALVISWFLVWNILIAGPVLSRLIDLVLLFILFKILTREARRYRSMIPD